MKDLLKTIIKESTERDILIPIMVGSEKKTGQYGEYYQLKCGLLIDDSRFKHYHGDDADMSIGDCVLSVLAFKRAYELSLKR